MTLADEALAVLRAKRHRRLRQAVAAPVPLPVELGLRADRDRPRRCGSRTREDRGSLAARGSVGRRDGAAHRLPSPARRTIGRGPSYGARTACEGAPTSVRQAGSRSPRCWPPPCGSSTRPHRTMSSSRRCCPRSRPGTSGSIGSARWTGRRSWRSSTPGSRPTTRHVSIVRSRGSMSTASSPIERTDKLQVAAAERPTDLDYRRYFALVTWLRGLGYRPTTPAASPFAYVDLPLNSILAVAEDDLACLQEEVGVDSRRARAAAERLRDALAATWDDEAGAYRERDLHGRRGRDRHRGRPLPAVRRCSRRTPGTPPRGRAPARSRALRAIGASAVGGDHRRQVEPCVRSTQLLARARVDQHQLVPDPWSRAVQASGTKRTTSAGSRSSSSRTPASSSTTSRRPVRRSAAATSRGARR